MTKRPESFALLLFSVAVTMLMMSCGTDEMPESKTTGQDDASEITHRVILSAEQQAASHIQTEAAQSRTLRREVRFPARIDFNQQRLAHLTARIPGRVEEVNAFLGDRVKAGMVLATIYSQQYVTAQGEYLQAQQRLRQAEKRADSADILTARGIFESARRKLTVLGATDDAIQEITSTQTPRALLDIRAPFDGSVTEVNEILGHYVEVGTSLFHVADLTSVWIIADIYEKDLADLRTGLDATIEVAAYPGQRFKGHLTRIFDVLDEKTRTVKARIEAHNPGALLKPQMFATVSVTVGSMDEVLVIPANALQIEADQRLVFVAVDDTSFVKRFVKTGRLYDRLVEILEGLQPGERIVTAGAFTVKSEFQKSELAEE